MSPVKTYSLFVKSAFLAARFGHVAELDNCNGSEHHCERFLKKLFKRGQLIWLMSFSLAHAFFAHRNPKVMWDVGQPSCDHKGTSLRIRAATDHG